MNDIRYAAEALADALNAYDHRPPGSRELFEDVVFRPNAPWAAHLTDPETWPVEAIEVWFAHGTSVVWEPAAERWAAMSPSGGPDQ